MKKILLLILPLSSLLFSCGENHQGNLPAGSEGDFLRDKFKYQWKEELRDVENYSPLETNIGLSICSSLRMKRERYSRAFDRHFSYKLLPSLKSCLDSEPREGEEVSATVRNVNGGSFFLEITPDSRAIAKDIITDESDILWPVCSDLFRGLSTNGIVRRGRSQFQILFAKFSNNEYANIVTFRIGENDRFLPAKQEILEVKTKTNTPALDESLLGVISLRTINSKCFDDGTQYQQQKAIFN